MGKIEQEFQYPRLPGYYTIAEAARKHGVSRGTFWRYVNDEKIPCYQISNILLIPKEEVDRYQPAAILRSKRARRVREIMKKEKVSRWTAYVYLATGHRKLEPNPIITCLNKERPGS